VLLGLQIEFLVPTFQSLRERERGGGGKKRDVMRTNNNVISLYVHCISCFSQL